MYPDDCIQRYCEPWWTSDDSGTIRRGRLLWALVPYPDQKPQTLIAEGRGDNPADHTRARVRIEPFSFDARPVSDVLPVAALPLRPNERHLLLRGKVRPVVVVAEGGEIIPPELRRGLAQAQVAQYLLVAPCYGIDQDGTRAGLPPRLTDRIRRADYARFLWDQVPESRVSETLIRLDHIFPIGKDPASFRRTSHQLSQEALAILDDWLSWHITGTLPEDSVLAYVRDELRQQFGWE